MHFSDPVTNILGVGESYAKRLSKLNIKTISDLLNHFPRLYLDYSKTTDIKDLESGTPACIKATLTDFASIKLKGRLTIQKATISDPTGSLNLTWFNQNYLKDTFIIGHEYFFTGIPDLFNNKLVLNAPDFEPVRTEQIHTKRIIPIYPLTHGITQKWLRHKLHLALSSVNIDEIVTHPEFIDLNSAYHQIHFPIDQVSIKTAKKRLAFNDLLAINLKSALTKLSWQNHSTQTISIDPALQQQLVSNLPYTLTDDQAKTINQIFTDLQQNKPMNRLVQGDVGTGKTIVAISASLQVIKNDLSVIIMAPTQVLAQQHYETFTKVLAPFKIKPILVTAKTAKKVTPNTGSASLYIGTQALLHQPQFRTQNIGLVIADEQHRFGVHQRSYFLEQNPLPHSLTMSATPIPRTIALSLYGHLDISDIQTKPMDRKVIKTWVVPENKRTKAYDWITKELNLGKQAFIICPLIDESEHESLKNIKAAKSEFERLTKIFSSHKLALLHGKLKSSEKDQLLADFKAKKYHLLVSTPVIEVGIDIPNANIMVIEASERFGLASLHQLRGRVGRGEHQSYCLLFSSNSNPSSLKRLKLLEIYHQGLKLAELDLKMRGSGEIFGTKQSGHLDTQFEDFWDKKLQLKAKHFAQEIIVNQDEAKRILSLLNPELAKKVSAN